MLKRTAMSALAAALCLAGGASAAQASAAASPAGRSSLAGVPQVNLHRAFEARLGHVKPDKIGGIVYALGHAPKSAAPAMSASCSEPNCNLVYNGGPVQHAPQVYLIFWGPAWSSKSGEEASAAYLESFYAGLGAQPADTWSAINSQYTDTSGFPAFSGSVYMGAWQDTSTPPTGVGVNGLASEADTWGAYLSRHGYKINTSSQIIVATQSGTCPQGFYAPSCRGGSGSYCAWHDASNEPFTNLPYLLDAGAACGKDFINTGSAGTNDGWSIVGGHEYAETVTDPIPTSGWWDPKDNISGGEIGDKCAWAGEIWGTPDPAGDVNLSTGTFAMQSLWSNAAGACVMAAAGEDSVTVVNPGNRTTFAHAKVKFTVQGASSGGNTLEWTATGLPAGVYINSATGLIRGAAKKPGTYTVSVGAGDHTGAGASATFTWTVKRDYGKPVTEVKSGVCLNDRGSFAYAGNAVNVWTCNGSAAQRWFLGKSGALKVFGLCLTDPGGGGAGAKLVISTCKGASSQLWTHNASSEYVLKLNGLCLTDPGDSTTNGIRVKITSCHGYPSQRWTLPGG